MRANDGHRIVPTLKKGDVRMVPSSRWEEIQECVNYHINLAGAIEASTYFRVSWLTFASCSDSRLDFVTNLCVPLSHATAAQQPRRHSRTTTILSSG